MDGNTIKGGDLLRLIGIMAIGVGLAWAVQTIGFGDATALGRVLWVVAAAAMSGAGAGMIVAAGRLPADMEGFRA